MAKYDFKGIKRYIQMHSDVIDYVEVGMAEDWSWTSEEVYSEGRFNVNFDDPELEIAGLTSSFWATPTMSVTFKDGHNEWKDCYEGDVGGQAPGWFSLGCLSQPVQDRVDAERSGTLLE